MNKVLILSFVFIFVYKERVVSQSTVDSINFSTYINNVKTKNVSYLSQKYNIDISNSEVEAQNVFIDPDLIVGYTDNQDRKMKLAKSFDLGVEYLIETGKKRKARIDLAQTNAESTNVSVSMYLHELQVDATEVFYEALNKKKCYETALESYKMVYELSKNDSLSFDLKLKLHDYYKELLKSESEYKNKMLDVSIMEGDTNLLKTKCVVGDLYYNGSNSYSDLQSLIDLAKNNREDFQLLNIKNKLDQKNLDLIKANKSVDIVFGVNYSYNTEAKSMISPVLAHYAFSFNAAMPLKFSNFNNGEIKSAEYQIKQSQLNYTSTKMLVQKEVIEAYNNYTTLSKEVEAYNQINIAEIEKQVKEKYKECLKNKDNYSDFFDKLSTFTEASNAKHESLFNYSVSLINLKYVCGIYDDRIISSFERN